MHVIAKKAFDEAAKKYPNDAQALLDIYKVLKSGVFKTPNDLKAVFGSLDNFKHKPHWYVIDIGGNNLRLLAVIFFTTQKLLVKYIVTHSEYDKLTKKAQKGEI